MLILSLSSTIDNIFYNKGHNKINEVTWEKAVNTYIHKKTSKRRVKARVHITSSL